MISSYGSIYAMGHRAVADILDGSVEISCKIDGSQISWSVVDGELQIRSKNQPLYIGGNNGMFALAVQQLVELQSNFFPGWVYRGEYLQKPKHNTLQYARCPVRNIILYDVERGAGTGDYLKWNDRIAEAFSIGLETVPVFHHGPGATIASIMEMLDRESILGGSKIEGVVIKNYSKFGEDKKVLRAKVVSSDFQEKHQGAWKKANPTRQDVVLAIIESYRVEARWRKAVQHLRDDGTLEGSPRDIGALIKEVQRDLREEEEEAIKEVLFKHFLPSILRGASSGVAEWYKNELANGQIEGNHE